MDGTVVLPGGLQVGDAFVRQVEFREMTGAEEQILLEQRKADGGKGKSLKTFSERLTEMLARCTVRVGDKVCEDNRDPQKAGTKAFYSTWAGALAGDRGVAVIRLRQMSLGDEYIWKDVCPACKKELPRVSYDLSEATVDNYFKDLDRRFDEIDIEPDQPGYEERVEQIREVVEAERIELLQQTNHEIMTPGGMRVNYRLFRAADEDKLQSIPEKYPDNVISALLAFRINSIDGEALAGVKDRRLSYMTLRDRDFLRLHFDTVEGGVDTQVWLECDSPQCGHKFQRRLDPWRPGFFHRLAK